MEPLKKAVERVTGQEVYQWSHDDPNKKLKGGLGLDFTVDYAEALDCVFRLSVRCLFLETCQSYAYLVKIFFNSADVFSFSISAFTLAIKRAFFSWARQTTSMC